MTSILSTFQVQFTFFVCAVFGTGLAFLKFPSLRSHLWQWAVALMATLFFSLASIFYALHLVRQSTEDKLVLFATSFAVALSNVDHEDLNATTSEKDPKYLKIVELEKTWVESNHLISDVYTMKRSANGSNYFVVDSETDYDRDGSYDGDREGRTGIGEIYEKDLPELANAFNGESRFTANTYSDKWGDWVSAFVPIFKKNGQQDGILGVDFKAAVYLADQYKIIHWFTLVWLAIEALVFLLMARLFRERQYLAQIENSLEEAKQAREVKSKFVANISHEIRTPLNGIVGIVNLFLDKNIPEGSEFEMMKILKSCSDHLLDLVNDVLDYSKMEAGKLKLESIRYDLKNLLAGAIDVVRIKVEQKKLKLEVNNSAEDLRWLVGDPTKIRQILVNLLGNALKFTEQGAITVTVGVMRENDEENLIISVKDTGVGISQEVKKKMFQAFEQADASTTRQFGGTGLGLAISYNYARAMGGNLTFESETGKGSTFTLTLPLKRAAGELFFSKESKLDISKIRKVLVVDDNKVNRLVLSRYLGKYGIDCVEAGNGVEALEAYKMHSFTYVFMDCSMPVMDGYEATRRIRELTKNSSDPYIIAVTAASTEQERENCLSSGMNDFLPKPFKANDLEEALSRGQMALLEKKVS